ncbi:PREDICTED: olfactory receptor 10X1-like [Ceratotherium simum simum]|uniref:Olfactory receptor n=1 Tax=Ceratotherium simum simum TaxID=73337 RepID=A0ABM0I8Y1_CERSS|nr:PREDICTED: olfactory receptor 10X1-like [Ceratotherium simum simum]
MKINQTILQEFILVGFSVYPHVQTLLFVVFFCLYLLTLTGNLAIMGLTWVDRALHTPMYLFLSALSFSETCYTMAIIPKMLADLLAKSRSISVMGCGLQLCFFLGFGGSNCFILTLMGYDRFLAICNPLRYPLLMTNMVCGQLVAYAWAGGFFVSLIETALIFRGSFCSPNLVKHFFCHMREVVRLNCIDSDLTEFIIILIPASGLLGTFLLILLTYVFILSTVLRIPSAEGKQKAFSTCASHITVVAIHFGFASIAYLKAEASGGDDTLIAVTYTIITPFLNPLIFSLRNKDMKNAFRKVLGMTRSLNEYFWIISAWLTVPRIQ